MRDKKAIAMFVFGLLSTISACILNIVRIWREFRMDKREEAEHNIRMCGEHAERLNESLQKLERFNNERES